MARALALFRLYDSENRQALSAKDVETFAQDCCKEGQGPSVRDITATLPAPADAAQFVRPGEPRLSAQVPISIVCNYSVV